MDNKEFQQFIIRHPLHVGERSQKLKHCGLSPSMQYSRSPLGYRAYCHRCGLSLFQKEQISLQDFKKLRDNENDYKRQYDLPKDFTVDLPTSAKLWLLKAGIDHETWSAYNIGYSDKLDRVILPVHGSTNELVGSIARSLKATGPKYISALPSYTIFDSLQGREPMAAHKYAFDLILTEDLLSAIRVGRFVRSIALLGTGSSDTYLGRILGKLDKANRVGVWLDPDNAGQLATPALIRSLGMAGVQTTTIKSKRDPKLHSDREIQEYLKHD